MKKSLTLFILLTASLAQAATINTDGTNADVQAKINLASDGDTVVLPAGEFSYTTGLHFKRKSITLRGQTTITGAGTATPTINDATVLLDDVQPRSSAMIRTAMTGGVGCRITGITFRGTATTITRSNRTVVPAANGSTPNFSQRIDHCHFDRLSSATDLQISGYSLGVADHNVWDCKVGVSIVFGGSWKGGDNFGHKSWADYPYFGTRNFFFVETNTIRNLTTNLGTGASDTAHGAREVYRYNYIKNTIIGDHGSEGGARDHRCREAYFNTWEWTIAASAELATRRQRNHAR